jgi:isoleucyl-tRNA synthetase
LVTELTPELELEGLAREFVRRVQELRKSADLKVDDRIDIQFTASERLLTAVEYHLGYIMDETLALTLEKVDKPTGQVSAEHAFDDEVVELSLMKSEG